MSRSMQDFVERALELMEKADENNNLILMRFRDETGAEAVVTNTSTTGEETGSDLVSALAEALNGSSTSGGGSI